MALTDRSKLLKQFSKSSSVRKALPTSRGASQGFPNELSIAYVGNKVATNYMQSPKVKLTSAKQALCTHKSGKMVSLVCTSAYRQAAKSADMGNNVDKGKLKM